MSSELKSRRPRPGLLAEDEPPDRGSEDVGEGVEGLGDRQAAGGAVLGPVHGHVGVGRRLDAGEPAGQDEQGDEEGTERLDVQPGGDEEERASGQPQQPHQDALLVADAADEQGRGEREQEVGAEHGGLDEPRLRLAHVKDVLEVLVQHVQHGV
jgi:hypothetical protein